MTLEELVALAREEADSEEFLGQVWLDGPTMLARIEKGADPRHELKKCRWRVRWRDRGNRQTHNETFFEAGFLASLPSEIARRTR